MTRPTKPPKPRHLIRTARLCVVCQVRIMSLGHPAEWLPTSRLCQNHVDQGHCDRHCPETTTEEQTP